MRRLIMALSNAMNILTGSFMASYDNRVSEVATICNDTAKMLSGFHADHEHMASDQHRKLAEDFQSLRKASEATMKSLDLDHRQMAAELHQKLVDAHERLTSDMSAVRAEMQSDYNQARKAWTDFAVEMQGRRAHAGAPSKPATAARKTARKPSAKKT
jgi:hypothetical protein